MLDRTEEENRQLRDALRELTGLIEKLDEAMASADVIEMHTRAVGAFVSGIDIVYTAESVIEKAIEYFKAKNAR